MYLANSFYAFPFQLGHDSFDIINNNIYGNESRGKKPDAIWEKKDLTYIIEAENVLNYHAIGQVFVYEYLYQKNASKRKIKERDSM